MSAPNGRNGSRWLLAFKENIFLNSSFSWERYFSVLVDERIRFFSSNSCRYTERPIERHLATDIW